jgi:hypothetical protein
MIPHQQSRSRNKVDTKNHELIYFFARAARKELFRIDLTTFHVESDLIVRIEQMHSFVRYDGRSDTNDVLEKLTSTLKNRSEPGWNKAREHSAPPEQPEKQSCPHRQNRSTAGTPFRNQLEKQRRSGC